MRPGDLALAKELGRKLRKFSKKVSLPGILDDENLVCLIEQIVDSIRRIKYIKLISGFEISTINIDTNSNLFDPIKGAIYHFNSGNFDEACWLIFLAIHFGKNKRTGWTLARLVYAGGKKRPYWTWKKITKNTNEFLIWLNSNAPALKENGSFGNHRKYESCNAYKGRGTGSAIISYIEWVGPDLNHNAKFEKFYLVAPNDPRGVFDQLFNSLSQVITFGRTAKFDYLTMLGKLGFIKCVPGRAYLQDATGPLRGARLLFGGSTDAPIGADELEMLISDLEKDLDLFYGMQVIEDSLCNWQKKPDLFEHFSG
ncbi:hypothetical protein SAMN04488109_4018 [Chryseolinea serpens]|uniref:Alpha-glutamyl/putrescinyl thymine pyrophosphorylase clade 3 domain-containing protein n=1 Tax=Chryseolinea serpens TaxID=947013 RepID=A0A1M5TE27_9BACT|nr:hypothetical protein [Chryseolinea serpens]SHH48958.1 hypothetical protein SAMN04488109_4018 [Chryseolinea serpens]